MKIPLFLLSIFLAMISVNISYADDAGKRILVGNQEIFRNDQMKNTDADIIDTNYILQKQYEGNDSVEWSWRNMVVGDADHDKNLEFYSRNFKTRKLEIKEFDKDLNYTTVEKKLGRITQLEIGDINGNGKAELMGEWVSFDSLQHAYGHLVIYEATGKHKLPGKLLVDVVRPNETTTANARYVGDIDGDGKNEILMSYGYGGWTLGLRIYEWNCNTNNLYVAWQYEFPVLTAVNKIAVGDFDNDGKDEFVVSDPGWFEGDSIRVQVFKNTGDNQYSVAWSQKFPFSINYIGPSVSLDYDGDGKQEFIVSFSDYQTGFHCFVFNYDSQSYSLGYDIVEKTKYYGYTNCVSGNLDNEVGDEIVMTMHPKNFIYSFKNNEWTHSTLPDSFGLGYSVGDFNQNGRNDLFIISLKSNTIDPGNLVYARFYEYNDGTTTIASSDEIQKKIDSFSLNQNYPNPFNPTTKIAFKVAKNSFVTLKIYNSLGQEVAILLDDTKKSAGKYIADFNASKLASGIYFYKLEIISGNQKFIKTKKMILMK